MFEEDGARPRPRAHVVGEDLAALFIPVFLCHSTFCTCSRIFSSSVFASTTVWAIPASLAFEPMVLNSRNNS